MRRLWLTVLTTLLLTVFIGGSPVLAEMHTAENTKAEVNLSVEQKNELAKIHKDLLQNKKQLISKYVEYGVVTKEQGDKITSRFDERYDKLEKNGFVPKWDGSKKHKPGCKCH
ncbi:YckD family protein [Desulfuribacillus alkaliarsenatis]|uniref:DUF2680 domain-containing protein n=1 Tax=Desulfuribacillus alkaliarsenatis TaxID=766136 RepID=A0A1E5G238_9FIRM|nr:YckD family protein [Desulfuribacillus alkaliarsenatis]OEF96599.1 hypothetical protein BHF68_08115 [Desulfuribacillus alkaliarsenatis]